MRSMLDLSHKWVNPETRDPEHVTCVMSEPGRPAPDDTLANKTR